VSGAAGAPSALVGAALVVAVGAWAFVGHRVARALERELPAYGHGLSIGLAIVVGLTGLPPILGRAVGHVDVVALAAALSGLVALAACTRLGPPPPRLSPPAPLAFWVALGGVVALVARVAWMYPMHDELALFGHKAMVEQLRNGVFPPFLTPYPEQPAPYHYGFDLLAGLLARGFGASSDVAIDLTTVALVAWLAWSSAAAVSALGAPSRAALGALVVPLGGGLAWLLLAGIDGRHPRCLAQYHHPSCGAELFPTPFLNLFQHPVSLGVPLALAWVVLVVAHARSRPASAARRLVLLALAALVPTLALGQVVYAALSIAATGVVSGAVAWRARAGDDARRRALELAVVAALGGALAVLAGGMFTPKRIHDPGLLRALVPPGFPSPNPGVLVWYHLVNLGLPLVALVGSARALGRLVARAPAASPDEDRVSADLGRAVVGVAAFGGVLALQLFKYTRSWDMVKFPSASAFFLAVGYASIVDPWLRGAWVRRAARLAVVGSGLVSALFVLVPLPGDRALYTPGSPPVDPIVAQALPVLRAETQGESRGAHRRVLAQDNIARELAIHGGIPVVGQDYDLYTQGVSTERAQREEALVRRARDTLALDALGALGVGWLVFSREEEEALGPTARAALAREDGAFERIARVPGEVPRRERSVWRVRSGQGPGMVGTSSATGR
jgi:hypothetical protein